MDATAFVQERTRSRPSVASGWCARRRQEDAVRGPGQRDQRERAGGGVDAAMMDQSATRMSRHLPFPQSLCHRCAAPPRYIRTATSIFILCPLLANKYPPQPVLSCPLFRPVQGALGTGEKTDGDDFQEDDA